MLTLASGLCEANLCQSSFCQNLFKTKKGLISIKGAEIKLRIITKNMHFIQRYSLLQNHFHSLMSSQRQDASVGVKILTIKGPDTIT